MYAGLGGNRRLWPADFQVTAIELDYDTANVYKHLYPEDKVVIADAHEYLLDHYKEFDFIWSSPPCQSHSSMRFHLAVRFRGTQPKYPDFKLYEEIVFLQKHAECKWVVENVRPYYIPLIEPTAEFQRHLFWSNFHIAQKEFPKEKLRTAQISDLQQLHGINLDEFNLPNKRQRLRNCVLPELGNHILKEARKV